MGRAAAWGLPTWIVLLVLIPFSGMGALPCLVGATVIALGVVIVAERRRNRRLGVAQAADAPGATAPPPPMSPLTAAGLTLLGVLLVVYIIFVAVSGN